MKRIDNKGYTLVELLLAIAVLSIIMAQVGRIMFSATQLYLNGNMEVSLQTDAQQVIKMFEELAIDCDGSIEYNSSDNKIIINNNASYLNDYEFKWVQTPGKSYGDLYIILKQVDGTLLSTQLLANSVASISLDKSNYDNASKVVFKVEMANDKYTYASSKDVYCRNHIGANDIGDGYGTIDSGNLEDAETVFVDFEILRYKEYNFNNTIPELYKTIYNLKDASGQCKFKAVKFNESYDPATAGSLKFIPYNDINNIEGCYRMNSDGTFECLSNLNDKQSGTGNKFVYLQSTENPNFILKCYTKDLQVGLKTEGGNTVGTISMETCYDGAGAPIAIYASGISLEDATKMTVTPMIRFGGDLSKISGNDNCKNYKYYQIGYGSKEFPVSEILEEKGWTWKDNQQYAYCDVEVCAPLSSPISTTNPKDGFSYNSGEIKIYLAQGYEGDKIIPTTPEDITTIKDGLKQELFFPTDQKDTTCMFNFEVPIEKIYVDDKENALMFKCKMFKWSNSKISGSHNIDKASEFYAAGGEFFFVVDFEFTDDIGTRHQTVKVMPDPICARTGDTCGTLSSDAQDAFMDAYDTGKDSNVETKNINGNDVVIIKGTHRDNP